MTLAMSTATPEDSGLVSGLVNTSQQVGGALGLSVLATLASSRSGSLQAAGLSAARSLTDGYHLAFLIGTLAVGAGVLLSVWLAFSPHAPVGTIQEVIEDGEPAEPRGSNSRRPSCRETACEFPAHDTRAHIGAAGRPSRPAGPARTPPRRPASR